MTYNNFEDLAKAFGVSKKPKKDKLFVCRKCGGFMKHIPETNVFLCENVAEDGTPCGNRVLAKKPS